jgi:regulator of replication initiation timing
MSEKERKEREITRQGWVAFDLDGTLAHYDEWKGIKHIGEPIPSMINHMKGYIANGFEVKIYTARICTPQDGHSVEEIIAIIQDWCEKHIGHRLPVTNIKDFGMITCYDDRASQVVCNSGEILFDKISALEAERDRLTNILEVEGNIKRQAIEANMKLEAERDELRTRLENKDKFRKRAIEQRDNFEAHLKEAQATIDRLKSRLISAEQSNGEFSKRNKNLRDVMEKLSNIIDRATMGISSIHKNRYFKEKEEALKGLGSTDTASCTDRNPS